MRLACVDFMDFRTGEESFIWGISHVNHKHLTNKQVLVITVARIRWGRRGGTCAGVIEAGGGVRLEGLGEGRDGYVR